MAKIEGGGSNDNRPELEKDLIQSFIEVQKQKAINDHKHLQIQEKKIEHDFELASKQLEIQGSFINKEPSEKRKTTTLISVIAIVVLLIVLGFMLLLINGGNKDLAKEIAGWGSYVVVALAAYFAGKRKRGGDDDVDDIEDAEIIP